MYVGYLVSLTTLVPDDEDILRNVGVLFWIDRGT
jgi:hypothetical protein